MVRVRTPQSPAVRRHGRDRLSEALAATALRRGADRDRRRDRRERLAGFECLPTVVLTVRRAQQRNTKGVGRCRPVDQVPWLVRDTLLRADCR